MDDLLQYITKPDQSLPELFTILQEYRKLAGYKLNYEKTEVMPLNDHTQVNAQQLLSQFKWQPKVLKYLGIFITNDLSKVYQANYLPLLEKVKHDLQKWTALSISLIGRVNIIKMNVLPKFMYLFQTIPVKCPFKMFTEINKIMSKFLWAGTNTRVKITTLQAPLHKGGLNLPNFKIYYLVSQLRAVWFWFQRDTINPTWLAIEQQIVDPIP